MWASQDEIDARFYATTIERFYPADPGDFRFEIIEHEEPELGCTHTVIVIDDRGEVLERFTTDDPYGAVAAAREAQSRRERAEELGVHPLELAFAPFGREWQLEQEEARW